MMDVSPEEVADRLVEAAAIEMRMPRGGDGPAGVHCAWPAYQFTFADQVNWDKDRWALAHHVETKPASVSRQEYDRWLEVRAWVIELVSEPSQRRAVTAWAAAQAGGKPFDWWCKNKEHVSRTTGQKRKDRAIEKICRALSGGPSIGDVFGGNGNNVHNFAEIDRLQVKPLNGQSFDTLQEASPTAYMAPGARPTDLLNSPEDHAAFARHLAEVNEKRRRYGHRRHRRRAS